MSAAGRCTTPLTWPCVGLHVYVRANLKEISSPNIGVQAKYRRVRWTQAPPAGTSANPPGARLDELPIGTFQSPFDRYRASLEAHPSKRSFMNGACKDLLVEVLAKVNEGFSPSVLRQRIVQKEHCTDCHGRSHWLWSTGTIPIPLTDCELL
ncbi:hypothetical protein VTK26DRAFT_4464 [Humicola hyalothermophila]